jgi:alanyl-tRNA synthetase
MDAKTLRQRYLDFFREHGHAVIGGAPLIPEHDPSVLFTTAGMHPLVPFLLGEAHPAGRRLANAQKCLRTNDILEVGDDVHMTFFEMLGNWSLGDYWKPEALRLNYTLLTERLGLEPERLHVTCFVGDPHAPRDEEAAAIWRELGIPAHRITFLPKDDNWWGPAGATGPCGPDSEVFYDTQPNGPPGENPSTNPQRFWEVCNNVFMQYDLQGDGRYLPLRQHNIDVGLGLERALALLQRVDSPYETELFLPLLRPVCEWARDPQPFALRVIADHTRAAMMLLAEGVRPGNVDQPYVVRRLIRRAVRYGHTIGINGPFLARLAEQSIPQLADLYPELLPQREAICAALDDEEQRFGRTLRRGETEFSKAMTGIAAGGVLPGEVVFRLYDTYGFPAELTQELAQQQGVQADMAGFEAAFAEHQRQSREGAAGRFRGGLAERNPATTRLHTATHLLHAALRQVLGPHVEQRGSNITTERLRFDFSHGERLSEAQLAEVTALVNKQIADDTAVSWSEMSLEEARQLGAIGLFEQRYGEQVKVYRIGSFSIEVCGGPHVEHCGELGRFHIVKEQAVGAGVRRIRAVLVDA